MNKTKNKRYGKEYLRKIDLECLRTNHIHSLEDMKILSSLWMIHDLKKMAGDHSVE